MFSVLGLCFHLPGHQALHAFDQAKQDKHSYRCGEKLSAHQQHVRELLAFSIIQVQRLVQKCIHIGVMLMDRI